MLAATCHEQPVFSVLVLLEQILASLLPSSTWQQGDMVTIHWTPKHKPLNVL
jgi:hypothetical protein